MDLLNQQPDDPETVMISWLSPLVPTHVKRVAISRRPGDPLPFIRVGAIPGDESVDTGIAEALIIVEVFCDKQLGDDAARDISRVIHTRVTELARYMSDVPLSGGRFASLDYVSVEQGPRWVKYEDDQILCRESRYTFGLSYAPAS